MPTAARSHASTTSLAPGGLPVLYRLTAGAARLLGASGARIVNRSPIASPLRHALVRSAPAGLAMVDVCGGRLRGTRMLVDLSCEKYYWLGTHEPRVQEWLAANVPAASVVYDVGAHAGFFTLLCAALAGPDGAVHAFEPRAENVERLRANLRANAVPNVTVVAAAAADRTGEVFFVLDSSTLQGRIASHAASTAAAIVDVTTIDAHVEGGAPPPAVIKIDVEGAEGAVLRGAARTIAEHRPLLLIEVHSGAAGREVVAALSRAYTFTDLGTGRPVALPPPAGHYVARPAAAGAVR
ncbi:MAG TPA: FkbM family methyltransferase [Dehalococcoidia bacterium]|nr:FkbM family methyltransferase [Dehalococcoidia bacterium]